MYISRNIKIDSATYIKAKRNEPSHLQIRHSFWYVSPLMYKWGKGQWFTLNLEKWPLRSMSTNVWILLIVNWVQCWLFLKSDTSCDLNANLYRSHAEAFQRVLTFNLDTRKAAALLWIFVWFSIRIVALFLDWLWPDFESVIGLKLPVKKMPPTATVGYPSGHSVLYFHKTSTS